MKDDLAQLDAVSQAALVRAGELTAFELVDAAIERIQRVNPQINAIITPLYEKARAEAASPDLPVGAFRGVPIALKDIQPSAGDPMHAGMRLLRDLGWTAGHDAYVVTKLRAAGFVIVGRTNLPELEAGLSTEPEAYGPTRNPWNPEHSTGGSSGGSAAAVASGMLPVAHGTDSGGSIRVPASMCGLVGLKPSRGRVSVGPDFGDVFGAGVFCPNVLTRSIRDTAAVLDVVAGPMPGDPYTAPPPARPFAEEVGVDPGRLRIGFWTGTPGGTPAVHSDCVAAAEETARLLESLGHEVEDSHPQALEVNWEHMWTGVNAFFAWYLEHWGRLTGKSIGPEDVEPLTWATAEAGRTISADQYIQSLYERDQLSRQVVSWWADDGHDLLLTPTIGTPPPRIGECVPGPDNPLEAFQPLVESIVRFTPVFNKTGQPAISLPLTWNESGLPIGVQLVASYGREDVLVRVASQLERVRPWAERRPPVWA